MLLFISRAQLIARIFSDTLGDFYRRSYGELQHREMMIQLHRKRPNQSPEPTAVGACRSAVAVHVTSRRWLSFFR